MKEKLKFYKYKITSFVAQLLFSLHIIKYWESKETITDSTKVTYVNGVPHKGGIPYK